jgi:hypothetical protein
MFCHSHELSVTTIVKDTVDAAVFAAGEISAPTLIAFFAIACIPAGSDTLTQSETGHAAAESVNYTNYFMTRDARVAYARPEPQPANVITAANSARLDTDSHFRFARLGYGTLSKFKVTAPGAHLDY